MRGGVLCGAVQCAVVRCGVVWCGAMRCVVVQCGLVLICSGVVWCDSDWFGLIQTAAGFFLCKSALIAKMKFILRPSPPFLDAHYKNVPKVK